MIDKFKAFITETGRVESRQAQRRNVADGVLEMRFLFLEFATQLNGH